MENAIVKVYGPVETVLVVAGKKGVTNAQMIPALRKFIEANDKESLSTLKEQFEAVYISSFKYLSKDQKVKHEALVNPAPVAEVVAEVIGQTTEQPAELKELA